MSVTPSALENEGINLSDFPDLDNDFQQQDTNSDVIDISDYAHPVDDVATEFYPADGESLAGLDEVEAQAEFNSELEEEYPQQADTDQFEPANEEPKKKGKLFKWLMNACIVALLGVGGVFVYALFIADAPKPPAALPQQPVQPPAPVVEPEPVEAVDDASGLEGEAVDAEAVEQGAEQVSDPQASAEVPGPGAIAVPTISVPTVAVAEPKVAPAVAPTSEPGKQLLEDQNRKIEELSNRLAAVEEMIANINKLLAAENEARAKQMAVASKQVAVAAVAPKPVTATTAQQPKVVAKDPALEKLKAEVANEESKPTGIVLKPVTQPVKVDAPKPTSQVASGKLKRSNAPTNEHVERDQLALTSNEKLMPEKVPAQSKPQDHGISAPEKKFTYTLAAVVSGRAHIQNQEGLRSDISYGDVVPGCGKVTRIDPDAGEVATEKCPTFK